MDRIIERSTTLLLALALAAATHFAEATPSGLAAQEVGPANGALVIVGGAMRDTAIVNRFVRLAGGSGARIVVIPTAGGADDYDQDCSCLELFRRAGVADLTVLHTYDPEVADTEDFVQPLTRATGVWFGGGRQWRLADSYLGNRTHDELNRVLQRGGVIGGSSAGASIQASFLVRGDTQGNETMMGDHQEGLGFLKGTGIDQHLIRRNRQFDLIEVIEAHPELLGIGIDENTAIVVQGDEFEVIGQGYVAIYDHNVQVEGGGRFYFLAPGQWFDLARRRGFVGGPDGRPIGGLVERPWNDSGGR